MGDVNLVAVLSFLVLLLFSAVLHEMAHAAAAAFFGDPTAREEGRISLNPLKHLDPLMSVVVPIVLLVASKGSFTFGGAKPVPINPNRFREGVSVKRGMMWTAAAGPASNFVLAFLFYWAAYQSLSLMGASFRYGFTYDLLLKGAAVNIWLGMFNLVPIPPLDGSKMLAGVLPDRAAALIHRMDRYVFVFFIIIVGLIVFTPAMQYLIQPIYWMSSLLSEAAKFLVV